MWGHAIVSAQSKEMSVTPEIPQPSTTSGRSLRRLYAVVIVAGLAIGMAGSAWSRTQLRTFQKREGLSSTWSLFAGPRGEQYRFWGTTVPFISSTLALVVLAAV